MNPILRTMILAVAVAGCGNADGLNPELDVAQQELQRPPDVIRPWAPRGTAQLTYYCPAGEHLLTTSKVCSEDFPEWLRGDWATGYHRILLWPDHYTWWNGNSNEHSGDLAVVSQSLSLHGGPLDGLELGLATSLSASCRVLTVDGWAMWNRWEVVDCPYAQRVPASECGDVGKYVKPYTTGSLDASGTGTLTKHTETITLERDRFFLHEHTLHTSTCMLGTCVETDGAYAPVPGAWDSMQADGIALSDLRTLWKFTPSGVACP